MENVSHLKSLAVAGGKALLVRHVVGFTINFAGGVVLARLLGPEVLGLYFISYTLFLIFRQLIDCGIGTHLIRLPCEPTSFELRSAFTLQQCVGIISAVVGLALIGPFAAKWYGHHELLWLIGSAGIGAYFYSWQSVPLALLERGLHYQKVGVIEVSELVAFNLVAVTGAIAGAGIAGLALGNVLRGLAPAVAARLLNKLRMALLLDFRSSRSLMLTVSPILGSNLVVWLIMLAPPVLLGSLAGVRDLGLAQLAYSLLGHTMVVASIFQRISLTALSRLQEDMGRFNKAVQQFLHLLSVIYITLTMGIASFSPWWIPLLYGERWAEMDRVMLVGAVPVTASALLSILLSALLAKGQASLVLKQNMLHAVIYWVVLSAAASSYKALAVPVSHLTAMSAGYLFLAGYHTYCGKLDYKSLALTFMAGVAIMALSWHAVREQTLLLPIGLWVIFVSLWVILSQATREQLLTALRAVKEGFS